MLYIFSDDKINEDNLLYIPTFFGNFVKDVKVDDQDIELALWDFNPDPDQDRLRPLHYPYTDVILMCFSTKDRESFEEVKEKWTPEVKHFCPNVPILLVGNKTNHKIKEELYNDDVSKIETKVSTKEGQELAKRIRAIGYIECCAKKREGLKEVFDAAACAALYGRPKKKHCIVQ